MSIIVITGRGGVGKSSFAALAVRHFIGKGGGRILAVDSDPDGSLGEMLGVNLAALGRRTVSDLLFDVKKGRVADSLANMAFADRVEYLFHDELHEAGEFDFISLGVKWDRGCYCSANNALRSIMARLLKNYRYVVVDSPGGLEHLNRKLHNEVDALVQIVDASRKARENFERGRKILLEIGIVCKNLCLVAGRDAPADLEKELSNIEGAKYLGKIPHDEAVAAANMIGRSLLDIASDSPAARAVAQFMEGIDVR
jgi:CO dehydrogenase maturation factor